MRHSLNLDIGIERAFRTLTNGGDVSGGSLQVILAKRMRCLRPHEYIRLDVLFSASLVIGNVLDNQPSALDRLDNDHAQIE
jgi:hypothetical protein